MDDVNCFFATIKECRLTTGVPTQICACLHVDSIILQEVLAPRGTVALGVMPLSLLRVVQLEDVPCRRASVPRWANEERQLFKLLRPGTSVISLPCLVSCARKGHRQPWESTRESDDDLHHRAMRIARHQERVAAVTRAFTAEERVPAEDATTFRHLLKNTLLREAVNKAGERGCRDAVDGRPEEVMMIHSFVKVSTKVYSLLVVGRVHRQIR